MDEYPDKRPMPERNRHDEHPDQFIRDMVGWVMESRPEDYKSFLKVYGVYKMNDAFEEGEFCVVSAFKDGLSKEQNLERQFILAEEARCAGFEIVPHTGFWDNLSHRCLFLPCMNKEQGRALCLKYELSYYIHGVGGLWHSYSTKSGEALTRDFTARYIEFDEPFLIYYKINRKKFPMLMELQEMVEKKGRLNAEQKKRIQVVTRQIEDLEKLEREVVEKQL